jgi:cysteine desulfurase
MSAAMALAAREREERSRHAVTLRDYLAAEIPALIPGVRINGDMARRLPNNLNLSLDGVHGESLLLGLDLAGIMASSGSACTSGSLDPSHVLEAIGLPEEATRSSLRLTVGLQNTMEEMERTVRVLAGLTTRLRGLSPAVYGV